MKRVYFVGKLRGFLKNLICNPPTGIQYINSEEVEYYEINSSTKIKIRKIFKSKIFDKLGLIIRLKNPKIFSSYDISVTYNRFLKTNKPYIIIIENPTALYHYSLDRGCSLLGKKRLKKYLNDSNLKGFICLSKSCEQTINQLLNYQIPKNKFIEQIYPLIPKNSRICDENFTNIIESEEIKCLFISSQFELKSGQEIIECFKKIKNKKIKLTIVSVVSNIKSETLEFIKNNPNINLINFNLSFAELENLYATHDILLHLSRQDSSALVVLEALKGGMSILATNQYALKEMVINDYNGYTITPQYEFFTKDNLPNPTVWNNRENTIYSDFLDYNIIDFMFKKIIYLSENREILQKMKKNSLFLATEGEFSEEYIKEKWRKIYNRN
ncbi:glycosyltransferase [Turicibacter sanguinis]|uniref:glycosyltransferase n=1 Tax=Turicibacter sanguinis TaxID=154288 RepID=UPI00232D68C5|nr:glycosyltransferase [Turicibacter sanguinis]MDB8460326.1 glycosyltransferase [Turicibacter sanguinis]